MPHRSAEELADALAGMSAQQPEPEPTPAESTLGNNPSIARDVASREMSTDYPAVPATPAMDLNAWRFSKPHKPLVEPRAIKVRRTIIPLLLTVGFLSLVLGTAQWCVDPIEPFSASSMRWAAILLPVMGVTLLAIAAANMMMVKQWLSNQQVAGAKSLKSTVQG